MPVRDHGYYGYAFAGSRVITAVALVPIIGMVGNFISVITKTKHAPPGELTGTLVVTCIAFLWTVLSFTAYDNSHIPYLVTCVVDILFLIPYITIAAILGGPLSITTCSDLSNDVGAVLLPLPQGSSVSYLTFTGAGQTVCYELQAVWGLNIALCILFSISAISAGFLWLGARQSSGAAGVEGGYYGSQIEMAPPKPSYSNAPSFVSRGNSFDGHSAPSVAGDYASPAVSHGSEFRGLAISNGNGPIAHEPVPADPAVAPRNYE